MAEHSSFVNSWCPSRRGPPLVVSGSNDGTTKLLDMCQRGPFRHFQINTRLQQSVSRKHLIRSSQAVLTMKYWYGTCTKVKLQWHFQGHQDMITGMQLSPDGRSYLLTNGGLQTLHMGYASICTTKSVCKGNGMAPTQLWEELVEV